MKNTLAVAILGVATLAMVGAGCAKKKVAATPPAAPVSQPSAQVQQQTTQQATTRATTTPPADKGVVTDTARRPDAATQARIETLLSKIEDAYFDYDKHTLRPDAIDALKADSTELRDIIVQYPNYKLTIEGHADERGSEEYNMALGDARAKSAKDYLANVGIPANQLAIVSYGKDKPACEDHNESCWQKNRRIHIVASEKSN